MIICRTMGIFKMNLQTYLKLMDELATYASSLENEVKGLADRSSAYFSACERNGVVPDDDVVGGHIAELTSIDEKNGRCRARRERLSILDLELSKDDDETVKYWVGKTNAPGSRNGCVEYLSDLALGAIIRAEAVTKAFRDDIENMVVFIPENGTDREFFEKNDRANTSK